jgi:hypothetical protein
MVVYAAQVGDAELQRTHQQALVALAPDFVPSLFRGDYCATTISPPLDDN